MQYIGKDVVTTGSLLHIDPKIAWQNLRSRAKQGIRKARRAGVRVVESRDLAQMAKVWYNPDTLTKQLDPEQKLFLAYLNDELVGGIIVTPVTANTLFYHYGGTNERGRAVETNAYLLWHIVEAFAKSQYKYLDVGVSFRPELQHYFQKYCTQSYPIVFHPPAPEIRPQLGLNPFTAADLDWVEQQTVAINTHLLEYFDAEFTYLPSGAFALQSALRALRLPKGAVVGVWASLGEQSYLDELRRLFGDAYSFAARPPEAAANIAAHRWGVPCADVETLAAETTPLLEDCRDLLYVSHAPQPWGSYGRYAVFDFARWFPVQFGAVLVGEHFPDQHVWDHFHCLDVTKRNTVREQLQTHWPRREDYAKIRRQRWQDNAGLFGLLGMLPAAPEPDAPPLAFLLKAQPPYTALVMRERLREFGVAAEIDADSDIIALPCHAGMTRRHVEYVFAAFRGMVNPCHTFVRTDAAAEKS